MIGYRVWSFNPFAPHPPSLRSIANSYIWTPGVNEAGCWQLGSRHALIPVEECYCGIWAKASCGEAYDYAKTHWGTSAIVGAVRLWGRIVEHEHGFRGQFAEVVGILSAFRVCSVEVRSEPEIRPWFVEEADGGFRHYFPSVVRTERIVFLADIPEIDSAAIARYYDVPLFEDEAQLTEFAIKEKE